MHLAAPELAEYLVDRLLGCDHGSAVQQALQVEALRELAPDQILDVEDADDVVLLAVVDGNPGEASLVHSDNEIVRCDLVGEREDVDPGGHHLADLPAAERTNLDEQVALLRVEDDVGSFARLLRVAVAERVGLGAAEPSREEPPGRHADARERRDSRREGPDDPAHRLWEARDEATREQVGGDPD